MRTSQPSAGPRSKLWREAMKAMQIATGLFLLAAVGLALGNPKKPPTPAPATSWATVTDAPSPPQGIIKDADKLVNEARATLKAFNDGGLSVTLAKPPKGGSPAGACPGGTCDVVTPKVQSPPPRPAGQAASACSGGACRRPIIRVLTLGRRG